MGVRLEETVCSTTSDSEECLRPSLLRKRRKPGPDTAPSTPDCENTPANHQIPAHWQTKTSSTVKTAVHPQPHYFPSDACCSPVQQTPFAPLSPSCPSTGAPSRSCLSPTAEHDLFGSPATSTLTGLSPACNANTLESPVLHKQMRHEAGPSKALAHISRLQRDRARLLQGIKDYERRQQQAELLLQDAEFLHGRLQELRGSGDYAERLAGQSNMQPRAAQTGANPDTSPAAAETLELWQQLSSESSNSSEAHQVEELQEQLSSITCQLHSKEGEVVALTVQLVSVHSQLDAQQTQHAESSQQLEAVQCELAKSAQQLEAAQLRCAESAQQLESTQQHVAEVTASAAHAESSLQQQLAESRRHADLMSHELEQSQGAQASFSNQLTEAQVEVAELTQQLDGQAETRQSALLAESTMASQLEDSHQHCQLLSQQLEDSQTSCLDLSSQLHNATQQLEQLSDAQVVDRASVLDELSKAQEELQHSLSSVEQSKAAQADLTHQLEQARQQLSCLSDAHVMDESTMLDQLSETQGDLQHVGMELSRSQAQQAELTGQLQQLRSDIEESAEAHTMTEATLLDQLTQTQAELDQSSTQVRHFEQRHHEMCRQLTSARVGQAEAMKAAAESKEQLAQQLRTAETDRQTVIKELQSTKTLLLAAQQQLQEEEAKLAAADRELGQSGMQRFELSQRLQDAQTQLSQHLEANAKLRAKLKQHRAVHSSLQRDFEVRRAEVENISEEQVQALRAELDDVRSQLNAAQAETVQRSLSQAQLQEQLQQAEADNTQAHACISMLTGQVAESAQQLDGSHDTKLQLEQQLQVGKVSLDESQRETSQALSDCLVLRCQLEEACGQLQQSCSTQAEYAVGQQRAAQELQARHAETSRLAGALSQAEAANQTLDAQLKDLHSQHRRDRAKNEQLAVRSVRYDSLQCELAEAQTQLAAHCAHLQVAEQKTERVVDQLLTAANRLSQALYSIQPGSPQPARPSGAGLELGSTAQQVCSLVEALLLHHSPPQTLLPPQGSLPSAASSRPVDTLRSHVAEAQARANHIVDEFESMLLVTGGHTKREVMQIQSVASLAEYTPPADPKAKPQAGASSTSKQTTSAVRVSKRHTCDSSTSTRPPSRSTSRSGSARRSVKSTGTSTKENRAPELTYVTGGQIRGARRPHEPAARHPLKPKIADSPGQSTADVLAGKTVVQGARNSKN